MKSIRIKTAVCAVLIATMLTGCADNNGQSSSDITASSSATSSTTTTSQEVSEVTPEKIFETAIVNQSYKAVAVDGSTVNLNPAATYKGLGLVTGNNSSRLLMDYKQENPEKYREILNLLFSKDNGAGLSHIKIEFGTDVNSSSGTEPSTMRSESEPANVRRGAGFMLAADALTINPDITVDLLRWGEPKWVADAFEESTEKGHEARYKWYLDTINAAYDEFGIKFSYISADANEADKIDTEWIIYFSNRLKAETNSRYDYSKIKIVASDEVGSWKIAKEMINNEELRNAVDVLGEHYNTYANKNAKELNESYGKEIWYSEGVASCNIASLAINSNGSGLNGTNGCLDVCNRIINAYYNGKMTMYEYQPAVAAYYTGAKYFPKSLINANEPWSGYYEVDAGVWTSAHFTMFADKGWQYIDSACFGDGDENHSISNTTDNRLALTDPETGDYSIIVCNDSAESRNYTFTVSELKKAGEPFYIWETIGPEQGQAYNANYLRNIGAYKPVDNGDGTYSYSVEVKPYSIITITTLEKDNVPVPSAVKCEDESGVLPLPYSDDFNYDSAFVTERGGTPKYTTDQGGAFEVVENGDGYALMQMINADNKPVDWRFRGTPNPITSLGDDRWSDYSAEADVTFAGADEKNYAGIGVRYICSELNTNAESGYILRVWSDGRWQLRRDGKKLLDGTIAGFDSNVTHTLKVTAEGRIITAFVDGEKIVEHTEAGEFTNSGRISLCSGYFNNVFDNLKAEPLNDNYAIARIDDHSPAMKYEGEWERTVPKGYTEFNRTTSTSEADGASVSFEITGSEFAIIGASGEANLTVNVDGTDYEVTTVSSGSRKACCTLDGLSEGAHSVKITVNDGKLVIDSIEVK